MKKTLFTIVSVLYILLLTNSLFRYYFPIPNTVYPLIISITSILLYPSSFLNKSFCSFLIYGLVLLLYFFSGHGIHTIGYGGNDLNKLMIELAFLLPAVSIIGVVHYINSLHLIKTITLFSTVVIFISFLIIISSVIRDGNLLRDAGASINMGSINDRLFFSKKGLPSYSLLHSYVIILPACIGLVLNSKGWKKAAWITFTLLLLIIIIKSSISAVLITATLVILVIFFYNPNNKTRNLVLFPLLGTFVVFMISTDILPFLFEKLANIFSGTAYEGKMLDFKLLFLKGALGSNIEGRQSYHMDSFTSFLSNPLIGSEQIGGHSTILDHLAATGILGFIPFFLILYFQYTLTKKVIPLNCRFYYNLGWISAVIILYSKGLFGLEGYFMLFFLLPGLSLLNKQENKRNLI